MSQYKPADSKREEFRKYLEKAGVIDSMTKVLVGLYEEPEKPNNALDYLKKHIGSEGPESADFEALKLEVSELRRKVEELTEENGQLKMRLQTYEPEKEENTSPEA
ncbi:DgyrCDS4957 [Dimorphilus gyrociliatus]|uniref:DgyrCDS4957 n=1 Tax=Dimorphilus gyrociliatus TaxID=2664684 RepID=A0A7I8VJY0_9ANNE|nr:DgyrCDS4957 [Dimorphilus gyrociliatus]